MNLSKIDITSSLEELEKAIKKENLSEEIQDEILLKFLLADYYKKSQNLKLIPERHRTVEMCVDYFNRTKDVELIPENIRYKVFDFIFNKTYNLSSIPKEYRTKQMCESYFEYNKNNVLHFNIGLIPEELVTLEMCRVALQANINNFQFIPSKFLTKKDYIIYFTQTHDIEAIPKEYQLETCRSFFQEQINKGNPIFLIIIYIPKEYREVLINEYYEETKDITKIPKEYRTQKMYDEYYEETKDITKIPEKYITEKMCDEYFDKTKNITKIPVEYRTQKMYDEYCKETKDITKIPKEYRTKQMCESYFENVKNNNLNFDITSIPKQYRTKEMYEYWFYQTHDINMIPEEYITLDMIKIYYKNHDLKCIPEKFRQTLIEMEFIETGDIEKIPIEYRKVIYQNIIDLLNDILYTKEQILRKFNLNNSEFEKLLYFAEKEYPEMYEEINKILEENAKNYVINMNNRTKYLNELVKNLKLNSKKELTRDEKIIFTYNFYIQTPSRTLETIWQWISRYPKGKEELILFFRKQLKFKNSNDILNYEVLSDKEKELQQLPLWIKSYNIEKKMGPDERPATLGFTNSRNEQIIVTKEEVKLILHILKQNNIPIKNCIVNEAIRQYAIGDLNEFIESLPLNTIIEKETKKTK